MNSRNNLRSFPGFVYRGQEKLFAFKKSTAIKGLRQSSFGCDYRSNSSDANEEYFTNRMYVLVLEKVHPNGRPTMKEP